MLEFVDSALKDSIDHIFNDKYHSKIGEVEITEVDAVTLGMALNMHGLNKTIIELNNKKLFYGMDSITRTAFENYVSIIYILREDSSLRAGRYVCINKLSEYKLSDKVVQNNKIGKKIRSMLAYDEKSAKAIVAESLDSNLRKDIEKRMIDELKFKDISGYPVWYDDNGKTPTLRKLCHRLELIAEYEVIYGVLSKESHSMNAFSSYEISQQGILVNLTNKNTIMNITYGTYLTYQIIRELLKYNGYKDKLRNFETVFKLKKFNQ